MDARGGGGEREMNEEKNRAEMGTQGKEGKDTAQQEIHRERESRREREVGKRSNPKVEEKKKK